MVYMSIIIKPNINVNNFIYFFNLNRNNLKTDLYLVNWGLMPQLLVIMYDCNQKHPLVH